MNRAQKLRDALHLAANEAALVQNPSNMFYVSGYAGEGAVQRAGNQIPAFKETQNYVRTVLALYHQLKPPAPVQAHRAAPGRVRMQLQGGAHNRGNLPPDTVVAHSRASNEPLPTIPNE